MRSVHSATCTPFRTGRRYRSLIEKGDGVDTAECVEGIGQRFTHVLATIAMSELPGMCKSLVGWDGSWASGAGYMDGDRFVGVCFGMIVHHQFD